MSNKAKTIKLKSDILQEKLDLIFANRQEQTKFFTKLITSKKCESSLLLIRGFGGIGKTMLLGAFKRICEENGTPAAIIDVGIQRSVVEVLRSIRDQLVRSKGNFSAENFDGSVSRYLNIDRKLRKADAIAIRPLDLISKAAILAPEGSSLSSEQYHIDDDDYSLVINRIYQSLEKSDADYFVNPDEFLTKELLADINSYAETQHLCIMFDRYEAVPILLDRWIRKDFFANLAELVLLVTSGRKELPPEWSKWHPLIKNIELSPFPRGEIQELLQLFGITSLYLVEQIAKFSGGVPLAISLAAQLVKERGTEDFSIDSEKYNVIEQLVEVLVRDASPELERTLEVCAVLRWFNDEIIRAIMGNEFNLTVYRLVKGYDFVRRGHYGYEMHDQVRDFINQDVAQREPFRYRNLNKLASEYYNNLLQGYLLQDRKLLIIEKLYHDLRANEIDGMAEMRRIFNDAALLIQPSFCQALIEVAEGAGLQNDINKLWVEYFKGSLARQNSDFEGAEAIFRNLAQDPLIEQNKELKAELDYNWGVVLWYLCRFPESLMISKRAMELNRSLGNTRFENRALGIVGLIQNRLGNSLEGIETVTLMVSKARNTGDKISEAYGLNSTGYFSWHSGQWDRAEEALLQSREVWIELGSKFGECYPVGHLGLLYTTVDDFRRGFDFLNTCLGLSQESSNREMESKAYQNFSEFERRNLRFDRALEYAEKAYDLSRKLKHPYYQSDSLRLWGEALAAKGDYEDAIKKHSESLGLANSLNTSYLIAKNQLSLWRITSHQKIGFEFDDIAKLSLEKHYYHILADIHLFEAGQAVLRSQDMTIVHLKDSLRFALKYNWHWLQKTLYLVVDILGKIDPIDHSLQFYEELIKYWRNETGDDNKSLTELEGKAPRVISSIVGKPDSVIDRLEMEKIKLERAH